MKINVTVDLSEFYSQDEETSFSDEIKMHIVSQVKYQIINDFKAKGLEMVADMARKLVDKNIEAELKSSVREFVNTRKLSTGKTFNEMVAEKIEKKYLDIQSVSDAIAYRFKSVEMENNKIIESKANELAKNLKDQHDLLFASQIVAKLNEQGLLKDGVASILLNK
jgi:hypothetical protein